MHTATNTSGAGSGFPSKRINEILRGYWESLRGDRPFPSEREIEPDDITEIWNACFLVKVSPQALERGYRYAYLGISLIDAFGDDVTQQDISTRLIDPASPPLVGRFEEVARGGKPVVDENEFTNKSGVLIRYRSCMLPFGEDGSGVNYILGGMKWKAF